MPNTDLQQTATEFQALPLEFIVATPLVAAVKAQAASAEATKAFILSLLNEKKEPVTVEFNVNYYQESTQQDGAVSKNVKINAPLLSIVPIPHLRIDSLTTHFKYEITQSVKSTKSNDYSIDLSAQTSPLVSKFVNTTLKGSVSSRSSEDSTMNRSGVLEITVHASEAPMPEGLAKILGLLANSIQTTPVS